jgi:hypothetical protein
VSAAPAPSRGTTVWRTKKEKPHAITADTYRAFLCDGRVVTVSCAEGETDVAYDGALPFTVERMLLIGFNDLTQLILGVDRDSAIVVHLFDERDPAVKAMIASVIKTAKAKGRKIGLCCQAPSDYPAFAQFLVEQGIDSISFNTKGATVYDMSYWH